MTFSDCFRLVAIRPKHRAWAWLAIFAVAAPTAYLVATPERARAVLAAALADPSSVLAGRSPGARGRGAVTQTKPNYARSQSVPGDLASNSPSERVLANVRTRPDALLGPNDGLQALGDATPSPFLIAPQSGALPGTSTESPSLSGGNPSNSPGFSIPGIIGGGGGTGIGGDPGVPPIVIPAVPEPTTWLMMLLGFFGIGAGMRSRRPAQALAAAKA